MTALRAVCAADSDVLAALHGECFPDDPWGRQAVAEVLAMPGAFGFLAFETPGETPSGFLLALALPEECEILALGVRQASRCRGVAAALPRVRLPRSSCVAPQQKVAIFSKNWLPRSLPYSASLLPLLKSLL